MGVRALVFLFIALMCMIGDYKNIAIHKVRIGLSYLVLPIQYAVSLPIDLTSRLVTSISTQQSLLNDNANLRTQILLLQAQLQKQYAIEAENTQLKALLWSSSKTTDKILEAQLLAVAPDPFVNQIVIDKGSQDSVYEGQPVLDAQGVMGQVIQVGQVTSRVMLLTDPKSAIPVQIQRNGVRAIAVGRGSFRLLRLANVTNTTDVQKGDVLVTSGLGQRYPYGYPVGTVVSVMHSSQESFADIQIMPAAQLNRSRLVLLIWPTEKEIDAAIKKELLERPDQSLQKGDSHD